MTDERLTGSIQLPDGIWVRGRGLRNPTPAGPSPDCGLYLGMRRLRTRHDAELTWAHEWLPWPDFLLPLDGKAAISAIIALREQAKEGRRIEVACNGGVGRTGTVLSCLVVLSGQSAAEAVSWVRANHDSHAVETPWQRRWVQHFATSRS